MAAKQELGEIFKRTETLLKESSVETESSLATLKVIAGMYRDILQKMVSSRLKTRLKSL